MSVYLLSLPSKFGCGEASLGKGGIAQKHFRAPSLEPLAV